MDRHVVGRMLRSTVQYALAHPDDAILTEQTQKLVSELMAILPREPLVVLIEDLRFRGIRHTPGPARNEPHWEKLLALLVRCHRAQERRRKQEQSASPSASYVRLTDYVYVTPELRYSLLYHAVLYALGDPTLLTATTYGWLKAIAPELDRDQRASIASDIRCYLEQDHPFRHTLNKSSWYEALEFLKALERKLFARSRPPKPRRRQP